MASITQLPSGNWRARVQFEGKTKSRTFPSELQARAWAKDMKQVATIGGKPVQLSHGMRFDEWTHAWFEAQNVRASSKGTYRNRLNKAIIPYFGAMKIESITPMDIQRWIGTLSRKYQPAGVTQCVNLMSEIMKAARNAGYIEVNPCERVKRPKKVKRSKKVSILPAEDIERLYSVMPDYVRATVPLMGFAGLRIGEVLALSPSDVDLDDGVVTISKSVGREPGRLYVGDPKTEAGTRKIVLDWNSVEALERHFDQGFNSREFIFVGRRNANVIAPAHYREKFFIPARRLAGLDESVTPHSLRHSAISLWIKQGATPIDVARRAGHASTTYVFDTYGHLYTESERELVDRINSNVHHFRRPEPDEGLIGLPEE